MAMLISWLDEWAQLLLRWVHVLAAMAWIGHAFMFHGIESALAKERAGWRPGERPDDDLGDLWLIHGGGFFHMKKTRSMPQALVDQLHWFRFEALFTWLSGFGLVALMYWSGGATLMIDPTLSKLDPGVAAGIGVGTLLVAWAVYDAIWTSSLARVGPAAAGLSAAALIGLVEVLTRLVSGRAAFLHVGALLGTLMTANVWMRILPNSRRTVAAIGRGEVPDPAWGMVGHQRSFHNGYLHFPIVFLMISNHYPGLYAHPRRDVVLLLVVALGVLLRQVFYDGRSTSAVVRGGIALVVAWLGLLTVPAEALQHDPEPLTDVTAGEAFDAAQTGAVTGRITLAGAAPAPTEIRLVNGCDQQVKGPVFDRPVVVDQGRVAEVVVALVGGHERWRAPPAPSAPVEVDQRGCVYERRQYGVRVGQPVTFINSDPLFHNVRTVATANDTFNLTMEAQDERITRRFLRPERDVEARCDVHPWMVAHLAILDHPWFAITGADGSFRIEGVPAGRYEIAAWHPVLGEQVGSVDVTPGGTASYSVEFIRGGTSP